MRCAMPYAVTDITGHQVTKSHGKPSQLICLILPYSHRQISLQDSETLKQTTGLMKT
ncbi:hypothetical protein JOJ88_004770 [Pantoea cypripedii]|nr:hypothetical protein [Pantoea cypripedii]